MKSLFALVLALSALSAAIPVGAREPKPARIHPVIQVERSGAESFRRGATILEVRRALGEPSRKLSPLVWVYPRFDGGAAQSRNDDCGILLVTFRDGVVHDLQLVNPRAEKLIAARLNQPVDARTMYAGTQEPSAPIVSTAPTPAAP